MKLEPLSDKHAIVRFLCNVDHAKALAGFVQELANAVTDYQVRTASPTVIFYECLARFQCNKECMRGRETSSAKLKTSMATPRTSVIIPKTSLVTLRTSLAILRTSLVIPRTS